MSHYPPIHPSRQSSAHPGRLVAPRLSTQFFIKRFTFYHMWQMQILTLSMQPGATNMKQHQHNFDISITGLLTS